MLKRFLPFFVIGLCLLIVTGCEEVKVTKCVSLEDAGSYQITKEYVVILLIRQLLQMMQVFWILLGLLMKRLRIL